MENVGSIILSQLGGGRFVAMTGSKNFTWNEKTSTLSMKLSKNASKANYLEIHYNYGMDWYKMSFIKMTGGKLNKKTFEYIPLKKDIVKEYDGVYCDMLEELFTEVTGMYTSL